ncbi:MAG TPA: protocatechuate 3,4-dioxygenase [Blastocatellia bacterium]|jgi:protocatechuate 3,4-dioxygenase beta subunit|nr:protocatechuate 3,4-dioxygenase [Blastocatellia bacterium]
MKTTGIMLLLLLSSVCSAHPFQQPRPPGGELPWKITVTPPGEPGEALVVSGTVYDSDGVTPLAGIPVYVYHTDAKGFYTPTNATDSKNSRLRGWMRTNGEGKYEFRTIKPGPYPSGGPPAHIHYVVSAPKYREKIFEIVFEGDPRIDDRIRAQADKEESIFSIRTLERDAQGTLRCVQDIKLRRE